MRKVHSLLSFPNGVDRPNITDGGEAAPVGRPDFKPGWGRRAILGRFDSCSLPPYVDYVALPPPLCDIVTTRPGKRLIHPRHIAPA